MSRTLKSLWYQNKNNVQNKLASNDVLKASRRQIPQTKLHTSQVWSMRCQRYLHTSEATHRCWVGGDCSLEVKGWHFQG